MQLSGLWAVMRENVIIIKSGEGKYEKDRHTYRHDDDEEGEDEEEANERST